MGVKEQSKNYTYIIVEILGEVYITNVINEIGKQRFDLNNLI